MGWGNHSQFSSIFSSIFLNQTERKLKPRRIELKRDWNHLPLQLQSLQTTTSSFFWFPRDFFLPFRLGWVDRWGSQEYIIEVGTWQLTVSHLRDVDIWWILSKQFQMKWSSNEKDKFWLMCRCPCLSGERRHVDTLMEAVVASLSIPMPHDAMPFKLFWNFQLFLK